MGLVIVRRVRLTASEPSEPPTLLSEAFAKSAGRGGGGRAGLAPRTSLA
jgi:hypothetical protein